jgi:hypothetical protein
MAQPGITQQAIHCTAVRVASQRSTARHSTAPHHSAARQCAGSAASEQRRAAYIVVRAGPAAAAVGAPAEVEDDGVDGQHEREEQQQLRGQLHGHQVVQRLAEVHPLHARRGGGSAAGAHAASCCVLPHHHCTVLLWVAAVLSHPTQWLVPGLCKGYWLTSHSTARYRSRLELYSKPAS